MKSRQSIITISMMISFSISIIISFLLTNNNQLQSNTICTLDCNNDNDKDDKDDKMMMVVACLFLSIQ